MTLKEKLRKLFDGYGRGAKSKLAKHLGVSPVYITRYAEDNYNDVNMPRDHILKTAEFFNISSSYLLGNDLKINNVKQIPIIGATSCGSPIVNFLQDDSMKANYNGEYYNEQLYCVIASGDSMATEIEDGDEIICDPTVSVQNGDIVHYSINGESAVKLYNKDEDNNLIEFIPYNPTPTFKTRVIRLESDDINDLKISKVVAVNKLKFNNRAMRLKMVGR